MTPFQLDQVDATLREKVRSLKDIERLSYLRAAIANGDRTIINAVLSGPSFRSGLSDKQLETIRSLAATD
jgi:hypothetical protein